PQPQNARRPRPHTFASDDVPADTTAPAPSSALDEPVDPVTLEDFLTPVEVEDLDDLVEVDDDDEDQPAPTAEVDLDDDFFANLGSTDESPEPDFADFDFPEAETEPETADEYADDFFSSLGAAAPADDLPEPSFADFGADFMSN